MREEKHLSPFERLIHNTASPYAAGNTYWNRKSMEIINMYRRDVTMNTITIIIAQFKV